MTDKRTEELLNLFSELVADATHHDNFMRFEDAQEIRRRIEGPMTIQGLSAYCPKCQSIVDFIKPKVSREFVEKWSDAIYNKVYHTDPEWDSERFILKLLTGAGVKVE